MYNNNETSCNTLFYTEIKCPLLQCLKLCKCSRALKSEGKEFQHITPL